MSNSMDRILEEAYLSGFLKLSSRKLKEFPSNIKYDLTDTVNADISRNKLSEIPSDVTKFWCLEHLNINHNVIKFITDSITCLQSLVFLDISHNQLTSVPSSLFHLPLEIILLSNNKLQSLPAEIGYCKTLTELDISSNQINKLPPQLGLLNSLKCLSIRSNLLLEIPIELTYLRLTRLDLSRNLISSLPFELKNMSSSLEMLKLTENPLMSPPATVCVRGMIHVFKWLEMRNLKQDKKNNNTADGKNNKWSDFGKLTLENNTHLTSYIDSHNQLGISKNENTSYFKLPEKRNKATEISLNKFSDTTVASKTSLKNQITDTTSSEKPHLQTYKEYKESLRLQRTSDNVYKIPSKEPIISSKGSVSNVKDSTSNVNETKDVSYKPVFESRETNIKPVLIKPTTLPASKKSHVEKVPGKDKVAVSIKRSNTVVRTVKPKVEESPFSRTQFTMRREFEKAKEEAELIKELRSIIETKLKVVLPDDLAKALNDGVVLCHLANHFVPQSIGSIHVPSPTVPTLPMARCRRNVDNFLEACRKLGVPGTLICCPADILEGKGLAQIAITVSEFVKIYNSSKLNVSSS